MFVETRLVVLLAWLCLVQAPHSAQAQVAPSTSSDSQFETLADRYWKILHTRPRRDTAFDLWYRHYLDAGKLDDLLRLVESHAKEHSQDANAQLLLGLVQERRGEEPSALATYAEARKLAPANYYAPYLRGMLLVRLRKLDDAAAEFSSAASLNPPRKELADIYKRLGRTRLQQGKTKEAMQAFSELADKLADDPQIIEELAQLLSEEKQFEQAERRWQQLAELLGDDPQRQLQVQLEVAQAKLSGGKNQEAIALLEQLLDRSRPGSWLEREIRRRLEQAFNSSSRLQELIAWCEARLQQNPQDLETLIQLARSLQRAGQWEAAMTRYRDGVRLAPRRRDLREALIDALIAHSQHGDALKECEVLTQQYPQDADVWRRLGTLHLAAASDANRTQAEQRAIEAWRKIAALRPGDATLALQTAEACRQAGAPRSPALVRSDETSPLLTTAEEYYREAVRLAPKEPQYYEYLGEFLHTRGMKQPAIAAWSKLGELPQSTAESHHRLAEVYARFGYLPEAIAASSRSLTLDDGDPALYDFHVDLLLRHNQHDTALATLDVWGRLAAEDAAGQKRLLERRVEIYAAAQRIDQETQALQQAARQNKASARDLWLLGLLQTHRWKHADAVQSLRAAQELEPDNLALARALAPALQSAGDVEGAIAQLQQLLRRDPRSSTEYYQQMVQLYLQNGRFMEAQQAAEQLGQQAPGRVDAYRVRAEVAFRTGNAADGLQHLQQAVKLSPDDAALRTRLARALTEHGDLSAAMDHYDRAFDLQPDLSDRISLVAAMVDLSQRLGKSDELLERLRHPAQRSADPKTRTLCAAEALLRLNRPEDARRELLAHLESHGEDADVLHHCAVLAERANDWATAVTYQQRAVALDPSRAQQEALASYLSAASDYTAAARIWERLLLDSADEWAAAKVVDQQLNAGRIQEALALVELRLNRNPQSWPLLLRAGAACVALQKMDTAQQYFARLVEIPDEPEKSVAQPSASLPATAGSPAVASAASSTLALPSPALADIFPEVQELNAAQASYARLPVLQHHVKFIGKLAAGAGPRPLFPLPPAQTLEAAKREATCLQFAIADKQRRATAWADEQLRPGAAGVRQLRRGAIASTAAPLGSEVPSLLLARLEEARPEDALPHVARLWPADWARSSEDIRRSYDWLSQRRPGARRNVTFLYLQYLLGKNESAAAVKLIEQELATATRFTDLNLLAGLVLSSGDNLALKSILKRGAQLTTATNSEAELPVMKLLLDHALAYSRSSDAESATHVLTIAERYLTIPTPPPAKVSYSPFITPSAVAPAGSPPISRTSPAPLPAESFPAANAYLDIDRLNLLQALQQWLKESNRPSLLEKRLGDRVAESEGAARPSFRLASIYIQWWDNQRAAAVERLADWCKSEPENKLLRLTLAQAHLANDDPRQSLAILEGITQADGELRGSMEQLRGAIRRIASDHRLLASLSGHTHVVRALAFSPNGRQLASASYDRSVRIWDLRKGRMERLLPGHSDMVLAIAWSPTGELLASGGYDGARLWSVTGDKSLGLLTESGPIRAVAFSPDGKLLATAGDDATVRLWNVLLSSELAVLKGHQEAVLGLSFSPDGKQLASASRDRTIRIWEMATRQTRQTLNTHTAAVTCVGFSPDGTRLASGSEDKSAVIWQMPDGKTQSVLTRHTDAVQALAFSADGRTLATAGADKTVRLWRAADKDLPLTLLGHSHTVAAVAFSPQESTFGKDVLASSSFDEQIKLWGVSPDLDALRNAPP